jgi:hypothetical protein
LAAATNDDHEHPSWARLSVVLDDELAEHVRLQAFLTRQSRSAYVRGLIADDANRLRAGELRKKGELK